MGCDHHNSEWSIEDVVRGLLKEIQILDMSHQYAGKSCMHGNILLPTASFSTHIDRVSHPCNSSRKSRWNVHSARVITRLIVVL